MASSQDSPQDSRVYVLNLPEYERAPQPTPDVLRTPRMAPSSPLKGFAIPITDLEIELFMDSLGDEGELDMDNAHLHQLFPAVAEASLMGADFEGGREILVKEIVVPVPENWGVPILSRDGTSSLGTGPRFWRATGIVMAQNDDADGLDVSDTEDLIRIIQGRLGVETRPGWYEIMDTELDKDLSAEKIVELCEESGSSFLRDLAEMM